MLFSPESSICRPRAGLPRRIRPGDTISVRSAGAIAWPTTTATDPVGNREGSRVEPMALEVAITGISPESRRFDRHTSGVAPTGSTEYTPRCYIETGRGRFSYGNPVPNNGLVSNTSELRTRRSDDPSTEGPGRCVGFANPQVDRRPERPDQAEVSRVGMVMAQMDRDAQDPTRLRVRWEVSVRPRSCDCRCMRSRLLPRTRIAGFI